MKGRSGSPYAICMKRVPETIFEFSRGAQVGHERASVASGQQPLERRLYCDICQLIRSRKSVRSRGPAERAQYKPRSGATNAASSNLSA